MIRLDGPYLKWKNRRVLSRLQAHLQSCYEPLLQTAWILDTDVTVKCLYGKQQGAEIGIQPEKTRSTLPYVSYLYDSEFTIGTGC